MLSVTALILAGGGGVRLWPYSRTELPKQFLSFEGDQSLLQRTISRIRKSPLIQQVVVSTQREHVERVQSQVAGMGVTLCVEPERKNTAPALVYALKELEESLGENSSILVLPSDHWMEPESVFLDAIEKTLESVASGKIVTYGIKPTRPETGYGYLLMGKREDPFTYQVKSFVEKPGLDKAALLSLRPDAYWNAGIFHFMPKVFWAEIERWAPLLGQYKKKNLWELERDYSGLTPISIDYALMEKSDRLVVCPLAVSWSDIGSWDSLYEALEKDGEQNVIRGDVHAVNTQNSLLLSTGRTIVALGVENLLLIETPEHLLVIRRGESQKVKEAVESAELYGKGGK